MALASTIIVRLTLADKKAFSRRNTRRLVLALVLASLLALGSVWADFQRTATGSTGGDSLAAVACYQQRLIIGYQTLGQPAGKDMKGPSSAVTAVPAGPFEQTSVRRTVGRATGGRMVRQFDQSQHPPGLPFRRSGFYGVSGNRGTGGIEESRPIPHPRLAKDHRPLGAGYGAPEDRRSVVPL